MRPKLQQNQSKRNFAPQTVSNIEKTTDKKYRKKHRQLMTTFNINTNIEKTPTNHDRSNIKKQNIDYNTPTPQDLIKGKKNRELSKFSCKTVSK